MKIVKVSTPGGQGPAGNTVWPTTGAPANTLGSNGDFANDATDSVMYGPKANGAWPAGVSYKGTDGTNGATWRAGSGAPSNALGVDGDLYLDEATGNVWQRASGTYSIIANIKGATGATGSIGPRGISDRILAAGEFWQLTNATPVLSNGTDTGCNAIEPRYLPNGGADIRIYLSNKNGTGPVTRTASLQWPTNLVPQPFTFSGSNSVTIPAGQGVWSDPFSGGGNILGCPPPGTQAYIRHFLSCTSGVKFELNTSSGGGQVSGTSQTDQTLAQSFNYGTGGSAQIGVTALVGSPLAAAHAVVGVGDSIMRGEGDNGFLDFGPLYWATGGFAATAFPWANCAIVGETGLTFATTPTPRRQAYMKYADTIVVMYGTNDIGYNAGISLATVQSYIIGAWWACNGFGARVIGCTLLPRASASSDNYTTVNGQTVYTGWGTGSTAALFNAWMRAGAPMKNGVAVASGTSGAIVAGQTGHPLAAVCNWTTPVEAGQDSGKWIVNGTANYATSDGTHPSDAAAQLMAAVLAPLL